MHPRIFVNNFFQRITLRYGPTVTSLLKIWISVNTRIVKNKAHITFLRQCRLHNVLPAHLLNFFGRDVTFWHQRSYNRHERNKHRFLYQTLQNELIDCYDRLRSLKYLSSCIACELMHCLPRYVCNEFFDSQFASLSRMEYYENRKLCKKFRRLILESKKRALASIKPISYFYHKDMSNVNTFTTNPPITGSLDDCSEVCLKPVDFVNDICESPLISKDKFFLNLTNVTIPAKIQSLLQLGNNFCFPPSNGRESLIVEFIKRIECSIAKLNNCDKNEIRLFTTNMMHKLIKSNCSSSIIERELLEVLMFAKQFVRLNPEIIFTKADKGNTTVALLKSEYLDKMNSLLN